MPENVRDTRRPGTIEIYGVNLEVEILGVVEELSGRFPLERLLRRFPQMAIWEVVEALKVLQQKDGPWLCKDCRFVISDKLKHSETCAPPHRGRRLIQGDL